MSRMMLDAKSREKGCRKNPKGTPHPRRVQFGARRSPPPHLNFSPSQKLNNVLSFSTGTIVRAVLFLLEFFSPKKILFKTYTDVVGEGLGYSIFARNRLWFVGKGFLYPTAFRNGDRASLVKFGGFLWVKRI